MRQIGGHSLDGTLSKVKNVDVVSEDGMIGVLLLSGETPIPLQFDAENAKALTNGLLAALRQAGKAKAPKIKAASSSKAPTASRKRQAGKAKAPKVKAASRSKAPTVSRKR